MTQTLADFIPRRLRAGWHWAILAVLWQSVSGLAQADPPKVTALSPSGVQRGQTVTVTAQGTFANWPVATWIDTEGLTMAPVADKKGTFQVTASAEARPGVAWVRFHDAEGASSLRPFLIDVLPEVMEQEPNDSTDKAQKLEGSAIVNGQLAKGGDVDEYAIALQAEQTCVISMRANAILGSPMDGVAQVATSDGFVLAQLDDEIGIDPQLAFKARRAGTYVVRVFAFPLTPDSSIAFAGADTFHYRLTICPGPYLDHVLPLAIQAGQPGSYRLFGWNLPDSPPMALANPTGRVQWIFQPPAANAFPLPVTELPQIVETRGEPMPAGGSAAAGSSSAPPPPSPAQSVTLPAMISGRIGFPGEVDDYRFALKAGTTIAFQVDSRSLGMALDAHLSVHDATGKLLAESDDMGQNVDPNLNFKAPADGEFLLRIQDAFRHGGFRYAYRIRADEARPDYALKLAADSFVVQVGKTVEVPVTIERQNGYADEIEISVQGLAEGVTAVPVKSLPKDDSAKTVKLVVTATRQASAGVVRITGRGMTEPKRERTASFPTPSFSAPSDAVWLTVKP